MRLIYKIGKSSIYNFSGNLIVNQTIDIHIMIQCCLDCQVGRMDESPFYEILKKMKESFIQSEKSMRTISRSIMLLLGAEINVPILKSNQELTLNLEFQNGRIRLRFESGLDIVHAGSPES
jgi:hypothetical protein